MIEKRIALGYRPRGCRHVVILGVRPNFSDYGPEDRERIRLADRILYPTPFFAQSLTDAGKKVFPTARTYYYLGDKIRQTTLFSLMNIQHPATRFFYGRQAKHIPDHFTFPFIAKIPRRSGQGRGVYLIRDHTMLEEYLKQTRIAYIQEFMPLERDLRVVIIAGRLVAAYWRIIPPGDFRANIHQGGDLDFDNVPEEGLAFALEVAERCSFDDVGLDVCRYNDSWYVLEANMHYGTKGLKAAGISLAAVLDSLIEEGIL